MASVVLEIDKEVAVVALIGIDIGNNNCKMAVREGGNLRLISARMPENMVRGGEVTTPETMAMFLRDLRTKEKIHGRDCALVLNPSQAFFRHVTLPPMTVPELALNLPYEFRDFINADPESYVYDYAVDEIVRNEEGEIERMELYAAAASKPLIESYETMLKKAGLKLKLVTPAPMAYTRLLREHVKEDEDATEKDYVLVDIGHADVIVSLYHGMKYDSARTIDFGCDEFDRTIADLKGIDPYTAGSYKFSNFEGVLDEPECLSLCDRFAVEVAKVVNFYNFNNPGREIERLCFLGGGARIVQLTNAIAEAVSVPTASVEELLPPEARGQEDAPVCALAVAAVLEGEAV